MGNMVDRLRVFARVLVAMLVLGGAVVGGLALAPAAAAQTEETPAERPTGVTIPLPDDLEPAQSRADRIPTPAPGGQAAAGCDYDVHVDVPHTGPVFTVGAYTLYYACDEGLWVAGVGVSMGTPWTIVFNIDTDGNV